MCVFCKILNGEIPGSKIYENEYCIAILDISQTTKGHTLVIPKRHVENIFELNSQECKAIMEACVYVANKLREKLNVQNINLLNNNGSLAGQVVMHYHMHIIPRYEDDGFKVIQPSYEPDFAELGKLKDLLNS